MSKHKKTRHQKVISDLRRKLSLQQNYEAASPPLPTYSSPYQFTTSTTTPKESFVTSSLFSSTDFYHDLFKTLSLTTFIVIFELILFFLLTRHIVLLPISGF